MPKSKAWFPTPASQKNALSTNPYDRSTKWSKPENGSNAMYSATVKDHALHPRNRREMENPDAVGEGTFPRCGDKVKLFFRLREETIEEVTFTASACGPAVAAASLATTMLKGRTITEAQGLGAFELHEALGGLPVSKRHAILMVLECLHEALGPKPTQNQT